MAPHPGPSDGPTPESRGETGCDLHRQRASQTLSAPRGLHLLAFKAAALGARVLEAPCIGEAMGPWRQGPRKGRSSGTWSRTHPQDPASNPSSR